MVARSEWENGPVVASAETPLPDVQGKVERDETAEERLLLNLGTAAFCAVAARTTRWRRALDTRHPSTNSHVRYRPRNTKLG